MGRTNITYRADIDGLRAIAIIAVVLFHFFPSEVPGGFIGVDIFFVISGYLITSIILHESEQKIFTLTNFYIRRIRRLFPALILVLTSVAIIGYVALFANELRYLGKHILGTSLFIENFLYMSESTYFNQTHQKILLNIWSLSLEEQFYLLWPLLVMISIKKRILLVISIGIIASFILNIVLVQTYPIENFYHLATRSWELLLGSLMAYGYWVKKGQLRISNFSSFIGISLIAIGLLVTNKNSNFPGMIAALPTIGTVLIIGQGSSGFINQYLLSNKVFVYLGKISYPLYLWHWPLLALSKTFFGEDLNTSSLLLVISCALILAIGTYHLLEKNIVKIKSNLIVAPLIFLMATIGGIGAYFYVSNGVPDRKLNAIFKNIDFGQIAKANKSNATCQSDLLHSPLNGEICLSNSPEPEILIIGDSHAVSLFTPLLNQSSKAAAVIAGNSCYLYPYFSYPKNPSEKHGNNCTEIALEAIKSAREISSIKTVLIVNKMPPVSESNISKFLVDGKPISELEAFKQGNIDLIRNFQQLGKKVIFVTDAPMLRKIPADCERAEKFKSQANCDINILDFKDNRSNYYEIVNEIASSTPNLVIYDPINIFCNENKCSYKNLVGESLYIDKEHISPVAATAILNEIFKNNGK